MTRAKDEEGEENADEAGEENTDKDKEEIADDGSNQVGKRASPIEDSDNEAGMPELQDLSDKE